MHRNLLYTSFATEVSVEVGRGASAICSKQVSVVVRIETSCFAAAAWHARAQSSGLRERLAAGPRVTVGFVR
jgi:hypothetical protein